MRVNLDEAHGGGEWMRQGTLTGSKSSGNRTP